MSEKFIEFKNVTYTYEPEEQGEAKPSPALCDIDLTVERGEFIAVLGHNGSGKSTLAKLTNAILVPESGTVTVDGIDTSDEDKLIDIRRKVGMVFQNPDNQIVATIVEDDVAFGPENLGVAPEEIRKRVDGALKAVGMYEYRLREPHKLSGGQKRRVAIAGVLAMRPKVLVLDEPTAGLDPKGRDDILDQIAYLHKQSDMTVILVSHSMEDIARYADRIIVMNKGSVMHNGAPKEVFAHYQELEKIGLAAPQVTYIMHDLKEKGLPVKVNVTTVEEAADEIMQALEKKI